jgi:hypothetical protein
MLTLFQDKDINKFTTVSPSQFRFIQPIIMIHSVYYGIIINPEKIFIQ